MCVTLAMFIAYSTKPLPVLLCFSLRDACSPRRTPLTPLSQKAVAAAVEKFSVPNSTHMVRLTCNAADMPYIGAYAGVTEVFM